MNEPELFVVEVREHTIAALTGHEGHAYVSPPQERAQALELVTLLLGRTASTNGERDHLWRQAIAGGQRSVRLRRLV